MTKIFLTPIRPAVLPTDPAARTGSFYYNTDDQNFRFYDGNLWQPFGTGGPSLSIQQVGPTGATETYSDITTLQFDEDSGFDVTSPSTGVAKVAMNSTFKYWEVDGVQQLTLKD